MNKEQREERANNIRVLNEAFPHLTEEQVTTLQDKLYGIALKVRKAEENYCNYPNMEEERTRVRAKAKVDVAKLLAKFGVECPFNLSTDSRGCGLWLHLPTKRYNTMGGEEAGWGF